MIDSKYCGQYGKYMVKVPLCFVFVMCVVSQMTASAQAPSTQATGSELDFFGIYAAPVFATDLGIPPYTQPDTFPFTAPAEQAFNAYDPLVLELNQTDDCLEEHMPGVLFQGDPMIIAQEAGRIVIRYERRSTVRTIHMDGVSPAADHPHTKLGYSVGQWLGAELRVETTHITGGSIRPNIGHQISREGRITERYWREPGDGILHMELFVDDPINYTETVKLGRDWVWAPDDEVRPWECISLGTRGSEPDIDELARMLEAL